MTCASVFCHYSRVVPLLDYFVIPLHSIVALHPVLDRVEDKVGDGKEAIPE